MKKCSLTSATLACLLAASALRQNASAQAPAPPATSAPDLAQIMRDMVDPDTREQALARAKTLPESAIIPLWDRADTLHSQNLHDDFLSVLRAVYAHAQTQRKAEDTRTTKAWVQNTGTKIFHTIPANRPFDAAVTKALADLDTQTDTGLDELKAVIDAGCTDPFVRYTYANRAKIAHRLTLAEEVPLLDKIAADFQTSPYPASRKFYTAMFFAYLTTELPPTTPYNPKRVAEAFKQAMDLLPAFASEPCAPHTTNDSLQRLWAISLKLQSSNSINSMSASNLERAHNSVAPAFHKYFPDNTMVTYLDSLFLTLWAWEARGSGYADTVTESGGKLFAQRLDQAQDLAEKGWRRAPLEAGCATIMITVCMGKGFDRATMETWFQRAIMADPDDIVACRSKLNYLFPKWSGSVEDSLAFGRWCVENGTGTNRIPTVLLDAHDEFRKNAPDPAAYLAQPEVWQDIKSVYEKLLADKKRFTADRAACLTDRGAYIKAAIDSRQWQDAVRLMDEYGNDVDLSAFGGKALYDYARKKALALLKNKSAPRRIIG